MAVFSFKRRFVAPIKVGLGLPAPNSFGVTPPDIHPKRQTIRAERKDLWRPRPGMELQLYCALRTKGAFLIGKARCTDVKGIVITFNPVHPIILVGGSPYRKNLQAFAQADGFANWKEMRQFWEEEHPGIEDFDGFITFWEPLA